MNVTFLFDLVVAYLLGSLSGALILGRLRGIDIRTLGSGNAGGTNALRTQGLAFALGVVAIDIGKGVLAVQLARLPPHAAHPDALVQMLSFALAASIGHVFPIFFGFRGGKGAATVFGGLTAILPPLLILPLIAWIATILVTGYVGLATIIAAATIAVLTPLFVTTRELAAVWPFTIAFALLIAFTHRANIARLRAGTESRFERARVLGRWLERER